MNDTVTNHPTDEMSRLTLAAREALTDNMVERLATTGANALELLDRLNDPSTSAAVHTLIDRLTELHKVGALDTVCDLAHDCCTRLRNALTDNMVERLFMLLREHDQHRRQRGDGRAGREHAHRARRGGGGNREAPRRAAA